MEHIVACCGCGRAMTTSWTKGRNARYPYYLCQTRGCENYKKPIRKEKIEGDFETLLRTLQPTPNLFQTARAMFTDLWTVRTEQTRNSVRASKREIATLERKIDQLMDRIVNADSATLITAYEKQVRTLEEEKTALSETATKRGQPQSGFEETYRIAEIAMPFKVLAGILSPEKELVELGEEETNQLFETLDEWNHQLARAGVEFSEPQP